MASTINHKLRYGYAGVLLLDKTTHAGVRVFPKTNYATFLHRGNQGAQYAALESLAHENTN